MLNTHVQDTIRSTEQQLTPLIIYGTQDNHRICRAQVDPVLGWEVVDGKEDLDVVGDLRDGFRELRPVGGLERLHGVEGTAFVLSVPDLGEGLLRPGMRGLRQRAEDIRDLVQFMPTSA
jgi:hypothetical protein